MTHRQEYRQWPFLTEEEFELACALLDRRYIRAKLGPARKNLKLRVAHTATTGTCYVEILRLLLPPKDEDDLSNALEKLSSGYAPRSAPSLEVEMMDEDGDEVSVAGIPCFSRLTRCRRFCVRTATQRNRVKGFHDIAFIHINHMLPTKSICTLLIGCPPYGLRSMTYL
jgi:hypothetical protein